MKSPRAHCPDGRSFLWRTPPLFGNSPSKLSRYSAIIAPCDNNHTDYSHQSGDTASKNYTKPPKYTVSATQMANVKAYVDSGGRLFSTHWMGFDFTHTNYPAALTYVFGSQLDANDRNAPSFVYTIDQSNPTGDLFADSQFVALLRSGFPLRLHYRLELWRVRSTWFDEFERDVEWDAVARHDPLTGEFVLLRTGGATSRHAGPEDLARAIQVPYRVALHATGRGRAYYLCRLEVRTLNESDLDELTRWLRGEVGPAVSRRGDVGDALARGAQRVLLRLAGLPRLTLEARSARFRTGQ